MTNNTCGRGAAESCVALDILYQDESSPEHHHAYPAEGVWTVPDVVWGKAGNVTATVVVSTADHFEDRVSIRFTVLP
ncbi:MAG: hypothetical protein LC620_01470 [Halobacteriales archaeon]|nr:hypothetical protein [Halobacteriales archaeon]